MNRGKIISALVLIGVLGAFGGFYQFYLKDKFQAYNDDIKLKALMDSTLLDHETHFGKTKPDALIALWSGQIQPWDDTVLGRAKYFDTSAWHEHPVPDESERGFIRFWYDEEANNMIWNLEQEIRRKYGFRRFNSFPADLRAMLDVRSLEQLAGVTIDQPLALKELSRISFGVSACQFLLDSNPSRVDRVHMWGEYQKKPGDLVTQETVGFRFNMTYANLFKMLDKMRLSETHFTVDSIKITYPYIAYPQEPELNVEMVVSQYNWIPRPAGQAPGMGMAAPVASAADMYADEDYGDYPMVAYEEPSAFAKGWRWFKNNILYIQ